MQEEVGIRVGSVRIVGSQPWPIGRGGTCELMIGAVATALDNKITLNTDEVCAQHSACDVLPQSALDTRCTS